MVNTAGLRRTRSIVWEAGVALNYNVKAKVKKEGHVMPVVQKKIWAVRQIYSMSKQDDAIASGQNCCEQDIACKFWEVYAGVPMA